MKINDKSLAREKRTMPLVKVIRNGQITIPKEIRRSMSIQDGDFLEIERLNSGLLIKPKVVVDRDEAAREFFKQVSQMRKNTRKFNPEEVDEILAEAVQVGKEATRKKRKSKANA
jgi:AbrB family looped-hinge helix DNA binding protein